MAHVGIGSGPDGFFWLIVAMNVSVRGRERAEVEDMARVAHEEVCPFSRAPCGNLNVSLRVL